MSHKIRSITLNKLEILRAILRLGQSVKNNGSESPFQSPRTVSSFYTDWNKRKESFSLAFPNRESEPRSDFGKCVDPISGMELAADFPRFGFGESREMWREEKEAL